jgi:hypothetical protein
MSLPKARRLLANLLIVAVVTETIAVLVEAFIFLVVCENPTHPHAALG